MQVKRATIRMKMERRFLGGIIAFLQAIKKPGLFAPAFQFLMEGRTG